LNNSTYNKINISNFKNKKILLLCHENADLDSFCSAEIFKQYLSAQGIKSVVAIPSHINEQTLEFAIGEKISFILNPNLQEYELICLFDLNDYEQLGKLRQNFMLLQKKGCFDTITFDHHEKEKRSIGAGFIDSSKLSTTQLLFELIGDKFNKKMSAYACLGMFEDTGRFLVGDKYFFKAFSKCLTNSSKNYSELFEIAKQKISESEKIAFLKAIQRAQLTKINHVEIITSNLEFYQGAAATKLLELGAHISIVAGKEKNGLTHLSARVETGFKNKYNFNLMKDLLIPLNKKIGGEVGGHSGAGQWKGNQKEDLVLKEIFIILEKKLQLYKIK
jgi:nanoRNase/pAp phosphatase (c-di-AMP/oligoRNAs hydrolase)